MSQPSRGRGKPGGGPGQKGTKPKQVGIQASYAYNGHHINAPQINYNNIYFIY